MALARCPSWRSSWGAALLVCGGASAAQADYPAEVLADSPVAYWRLDDPAPPAADASGSGRGARVTMAAVEFGRDPLHLNSGGGAVALSGSGQLTTDPFEKIDGGGFAVEFWVRFDSEPLGFTNLVGDGEAASDFNLMVYAGPGGFIRAHAQTTAGVAAADSAERIAFGGTHHIVSTWDAATGGLSLFIDGEQVASATANGSPLHSDNPIFIGQDGREPRAPHATIDEVALYNAPLPAARIAAHFAAAEVPDPPDPPDPPQPFGVAVGSSRLISQLDYSDTFTIGAAARSAARQSYAPQGFPLPPGVEVVEDNYDNLQSTWPSDAWSIATDSAVNPGATGYPGASGAGSSSGFTQRGGGGDWSIPYGLRDVFVVQADFVQLDDRVDLTVGATPGDIFGAGNISIFLRRTDHPSFPEIGIFNGSLETDTGLASGIPTTRQWFNYALAVDVPRQAIEVFVNEESRGTIDLNTVGGGAYAGILNNSFVGTGGAGNDRLWSDNFQVGAPAAQSPLAITSVAYEAESSAVDLAWTSTPGTTYALDLSFDLARWTEVNDGIASGGHTTSHREDLSAIIPPDQAQLFLRIRQPEDQ